MLNVLCTYTILMCAFFDSLDAIGQTILENRNAGEYIVIIKKVKRDWNTISIGTYDGDQTLKDEIEFFEAIGGADDCGSWSKNSEYTFTDNLHFVVNTKEYNETCRLQQDATESDEEFETSLLKYVDPRDMLGRSSSIEAITLYEIGADGKLKATSSTKQILNDKYTGLELILKVPKTRLRFLRNAIFAKYGYRFKSAELQNYFTSQSWYKPEFDNVDDKLTSGDKELIAYIKNLEDQK